LPDRRGQPVIPNGRGSSRLGLFVFPELHAVFQCSSG
jgi:hypothetical protein